MHPLVPVGLSVVVLLVSAKARGRELRLERELAGHLVVNFSGQNHEWVVAFWRRDRVRFWRLSGLLMGLLVSAAIGLYPAGWPWFLTAAPMIAMSVSFMVMGAWSLARRSAATRTGIPPNATWAARAARGSAFWWSLVAASSIPLVVSLSFG